VRLFLVLASVVVVGESALAAVASSCCWRMARRLKTRVAMESRGARSSAESGQIVCGGHLGAGGVWNTRSARLMSATSSCPCWWRWEAPGMKSTGNIISPSCEEYHATVGEKG
jgi:hypothetical protein